MSSSPGSPTPAPARLVAVPDDADHVGASALDAADLEPAQGLAVVAGAVLERDREQPGARPAAAGERCAESSSAWPTATSA